MTSQRSSTGQRALPTRRTRHHPRTSNLRSQVPEIYHEMLAEAVPSGSDGQDRPVKRRKVRGDYSALADSTSSVIAQNDEISDDNIEFEDVLPAGKEQIIYDDSEDSSDDEQQFEDIELDAYQSTTHDESDTRHLDLTLTATLNVPTAARKKVKVFTKAEREAHLEIHKMHLLCLLTHVDQRNDWCNDEVVRHQLKELVTPKIRQFLTPESDWTAFRKSESVKRGLEDIGKLWRSKFNVSARGMRRPFWVEDVNDLKKFKLPADYDPPFSKRDFQKAAEELDGSRDIGAQLYCSLLRSLNLEVRLVCSLQPLPLSASFKSSAPNRADPGGNEEVVLSPMSDEEKESLDVQRSVSPFVGRSNATHGRTPPLVRRRLGHPNATNYQIPDIRDPLPPTPPKPRIKRIVESPYPVFWVEVLDEAHQKWMPVDPLVTNTVNKPRAFEPPASDGENAMSYVVAFEPEGTARDVTRRYTKWYAAKTRRSRVESTEGGERWWRKTTRFYSRGWKTELDENEDIALANAELREGMPMSIADFKDHPRFVLERDIKRNEALITRHEVGKVAAGKSKQLEPVFRRSDVKGVKSADGWYRLGRNVKIGEQPVKTRTNTRRRVDPAEGDEENEVISLYTENQTELVVSPPVVNGKVPRNKFGNFDVYVPSMVPEGGVHIRSPDASRAAQLLGVDYARAVTGFEFRGRQGTAVLDGVIVAAEYREAVEAVLDGLSDERALAEEERRLAIILRSWKRFMIGLRIKQRVDSYVVEGEEVQQSTIEVQEDDSGMESEEYEDDGGGGFFPE